MELNAKFKDTDNQMIQNRIEILRECTARNAEPIDMELYAIQLEVLMYERCARIEAGIWNIAITTVEFSELTPFAKVVLQIEERMERAKEDHRQATHKGHKDFFDGRFLALKELWYDIKDIKEMAKK